MGRDALRPGAGRVARVAGARVARLPQQALILLLILLVLFLISPFTVLQMLHALSKNTEFKNHQVYKYGMQA